MKIKRPTMSYLKQLTEPANYYGFNNSTYLFLEEVGFFLASGQHKVDSAAGRPGRCSQPSLPNRPHFAKLNYLTNFALYFFVLEIFLTHFSYSCFSQLKLRKWVWLISVGVNVIKICWIPMKLRNWKWFVMMHTCAQNCENNTILCKRILLNC